MSNLVLNLMAIVFTMSMNLNPIVIDKLTDKELAIMPEESGIAVFLDAPTRYNFLCTDQSRGEVLSATLTNDGALRLTYSSFWPDGTLTNCICCLRMPTMLVLPNKQRHPWQPHKRRPIRT